MDKSYTFVRGQVWYWEDPIYGSKERQEELHPRDASIRFSRYVLVAQTTESISPISVLVIPCSSCNKGPFDIQVPLNHISHENISYARISSLFPAHPRCLQRYICTLSETTMKKIDEKLLGLLIPGAANMSQVNDNYIPTEYETDTSIEENEDPDPQIKVRNQRWDKNSITRFFDLYNNDGISAVCDEFGLKPVSVRKYHALWSNEAPKMKESQSIHFDPNRIRLIGSDDAPFVVSKISNIIKDGLQEALLYDEIKPHILDYPLKGSDDFYKDLGSSIYHTLLSFLEIRKDLSEFIIPNVDQDAMNIGTWFFLDRIYYDAHLSMIKDGDMLMQAYQHYYGDLQQGIDYKWLSPLYQKLITKVGLTEDGATIICDKIDNTFCTIKKKE